MNIKIVKLEPGNKLPVKMSPKAGAWDVFGTEIIRESDNYYRCKLGLKMTPPPGYRIVFVPRSSITRTQWILQNSPATGDEDFTGEYELRFKCIPYTSTESAYKGTSYEKFPFKVGDRIAQMYLEKVEEFEFQEVNSLDETDRGKGGFGSTGN
jgi:dUTP pyrophosphatase